jgi:nucleotide-binding universal stress UspA family protein/hemerythrin-like domain-containing protein
MYRHLMVPVDDSVLSSINAEAAVQLAARLGSRITFFHAAPDLGATRAGARLKSNDPRAFAESAFGDTHAMLAKYGVSAEALGVPYDTLYATSGHPADAIVEAARSNGCDLIVMATHGARGIAGALHGSQTERVLHQSTLPLLVTRIASTDPLKDMEQVLAVLHDEHQSILAVTRAMQDMVNQAPALGASLDLGCLEAMLNYLQAFPLSVHHPKEESFLHRALRDRAPEYGTLLRDIEAQHATEHALVKEALASLEPVVSEMGAPSDILFGTVLALADVVREHIALEEQTVLPLARKRLHADDWSVMAPAFESHDFPGFGAMSGNEARRLFTWIADLHLGVGGPRSGHPES